jgi:DNA-directed RNA polymerase specialized sigma24 family protein
MAMADALRELPPLHRRVLAETFFRGRTTVAAAAVLGMPADTIKTVLNDALRALRQQLAADEQRA